MVNTQKVYTPTTPMHFFAIIAANWVLAGPFK